MCMHMHWYVPICRDFRKPEVSGKYPAQSLSTLFFETGLSLNLEPIYGF